MYERCPECDLKYEREQGYFLGAMYFSYCSRFRRCWCWCTAAVVADGWRFDW